MANYIKKTFLSIIMGFMLIFMVSGISTNAAEYAVTDVMAVLYTNENTVLCSDADMNTVVVPKTEAKLPIQVTGVTSNGYFRISLSGQVFYIPGAGLSAAQEQTASVSVYDILVAQKSVFPEGMHWTNDDYCPFKGGIFYGGYGCAAFAFYLSDAAFGNAQARIHTDYNNIRVGDILRIYNDTHSVIVLKVNPDSVTVAEGNYNSTIHWGRVIPKSQIVDSESYIMTRY